jgi:hypothetical protein
LQPKEIKNLDVVAIIAVKKLFLTNLVAKLIWNSGKLVT